MSMPSSPPAAQPGLVYASLRAALGLGSDYTPSSDRAPSSQLQERPFAIVPSASEANVPLAFDTAIRSANAPSVEFLREELVSNARSAFDAHILERRTSPQRLEAERRISEAAAVAWRANGNATSFQTPPRKSMVGTENTRHIPISPHYSDGFVQPSGMPSMF